MTDRAHDIGLIEAAFRIANERTARWEERHAEGRSELYLCECGEQPCRKRIPLTREQYEAVRADARHFVVLPGHAIPDVETVIGSFAGYEVIEKPTALMELLVRPTLEARRPARKMTRRSPWPTRSIRTPPRIAGPGGHDGPPCSRFDRS
jgi:hypothetical protein